MKQRKVTIILGAGASKAYARWPYPLLSKLLPQILLYADKLNGKGGRQRLYLAYAIEKAHRLDGPDLGSGRIPEGVIQEEFERVKALPPNHFHLPAAFERLEKLNDEGTKAYWALTYATAIYLWQMEHEDIDQSCIGHIDRAHQRLILLIDRLLSDGITVNVVDFNWDCVLERVRYSLGPRTFGWNCGRERRVIADSTDDIPLSAWVEKNRFQPPLDRAEYSAFAGLIKPHGDMCTFLRGTTDVFYRGGRHSHTHTATFPPRLSDISSDDRFVRSSILPPTNSRFRHKSRFYEEEKQRLITALSDCDTVIIIGWSASGSDNLYREIFRKAFPDNSRRASLCVIDLNHDTVPDGNLQTRLRELFGAGVTLRDVQMSGFNNQAVERLQGLLFRQLGNG